LFKLPLFTLVAAVWLSGNVQLSLTLTKLFDVKLG